VALEEKRQGKQQSKVWTDSHDSQACSGQLILVLQNPKHPKTCTKIENRAVLSIDQAFVAREEAQDARCDHQPLRSRKSILQLAEKDDPTKTKKN